MICDMSYFRHLIHLLLLSAIDVLLSDAPSCRSGRVEAYKNDTMNQRKTKCHIEAEDPDIGLQVNKSMALTNYTYTNIGLFDILAFDIFDIFGDEKILRLLDFTVYRSMEATSHAHKCIGLTNINIPGDELFNFSILTRCTSRRHRRGHRSRTTHECTRHIEDTMDEVEHNLFDYFGHQEAEHAAVINNITQQWVRAHIVDRDTKVDVVKTYSEVELGGEYNSFYVEDNTNTHRRRRRRQQQRSTILNAHRQTPHRQLSHREPAIDNHSLTAILNVIFLSILSSFTPVLLNFFDSAS